MRMRTIIAAALAAAAGSALGFSAAAGGGTKVTQLRASVGPGYTITLTRAGRRVTRLAPGTYRITVSDRSAIHSFKLEKSGGAFERSLTSVPFMGTRVVTVRMTAGTWEYYCVSHESTMKGHFTVGAGAATTTEDHGGGGIYG